MRAYFDDAPPADAAWAVYFLIGRRPKRLLSATLLVGVAFGEHLYGHGVAWKWDHKTVFSLLAWLTFAVLLVGRARFGWRGRRAVRVLYVGAGLLLLAYVGSRFVLEIVLGRAT